MIEISRVKSKRKPAICKRCRDCKWLSAERCTVGRLCTNPRKEFRTGMACWKYPSNKACKLFREKAVSG